MDGTRGLAWVMESSRLALADFGEGSGAEVDRGGSSLLEAEEGDEDGRVEASVTLKTPLTKSAQIDEIFRS